MRRTNKNNNTNNNKRIQKIKIKQNVNNLRRFQAIKNRQKRSLPAAQTNSFNKRFYVDQLTSTQARVSGTDLVYAIPDNLETNNSSSVITVIPSNPAYWVGTRIAALATGYQNYRPLKFEVHYVPQCAVTQQGNVLAGTLWHDAPPVTNLQQTLRTSNGGMLTQCYKPSISRVKVGANLQYNLYRMAGDINEQSMPFIFIALAIACKDSNQQRINPGYFYVSYTYLFKNPTGYSTIYNNSGLTTFLEASPNIKKQNMIAILCSQLVSDNMTLDIGTKLDIEYDDINDLYNFYYNQSLVPSPAGLVWILSNGNTTQLTREQMEKQTKLPINYSTIEDVDPIQGVRLLPNQGITYEDNSGQLYTMINQLNSITTLFPDIDKVYKIVDGTQNLGEFYGIYDGLAQFLAPTIRYFMKQSNQVKEKQGPIPPISKQENKK